MQILRSSTSKSCRFSQILPILTSESLSRHSVVQILQASTSKSASTPPVFNDFDFRTDLPPQRGAYFGASTSKSAPTVPNRSRATAWCKFFGIQLQKIQKPSVFNNFDFRIALATAWCKFWLHLGYSTRSSAPARFSELTFRAGEATKLLQNTAFRGIPTRQSLMSHIPAVSHPRNHISWLTDLQRQLSV